MTAWLREIFEVRVALRYYAFALAFSVALFLGAAVIYVALFDGVVTPDVLPGIVESPLFLGFIILFGGGLEGPGWRGCLLPAPQRTARSQTGSSLASSGPGGHLPLVLIPGTIQQTLPLGLSALARRTLDPIDVAHEPIRRERPAGDTLARGRQRAPELLPLRGVSRVRRRFSDLDFSSRRSPSPSSPLSPLLGRPWP
mgnify:CR=1 FL=1